MPGLEQFLSAGATVVGLLMFWFYLGYHQKWLWRHNHEQVIAELRKQITDRDKTIEKLEASERFWMTNAMKSTHIAEKVVDIKAVA